MIEALLAKKATWWTAGLLTGILGPVVSSALQDIALIATAFAGIGFLTAKIILPASRALRASVQAPAQLRDLEKKFEKRFDQFEDRFERKLDDALKRLHHDRGE